MSVVGGKKCSDSSTKTWVKFRRLQLSVPRLWRVRVRASTARHDFASTRLVLLNRSNVPGHGRTMSLWAYTRNRKGALGVVSG